MRQFRLQISNPSGQKISFGKRRLGEIGRDITAAKIALGAIISPESLPNQPENFELLDPNGWLDCTTGEEISQTQAATFDKNMQLRLMKFQLDNQLLIVSYLFHKFGISQIISDASTKLGVKDRDFSDWLESHSERSSRDKIEYDDLTPAGKRAVRAEISKDVVDGVINLFAGELGTLGEATLAVMHGWVPQARYSNSSYYHLQPGSLPGRANDDIVVDIIPIDLYDQYINGNLTQKPGSWASNDTIDSPNVDSPNFRNNQSHYRSFVETAPGNYIWPMAEGFQYGTIIYKFKGLVNQGGENIRSTLYTATMQALEAEPSFEDETRLTAPLSSDETNESLSRAVQPDPLTDPDPFTVNSSTVGFFDIATISTGETMTIDNLSSWVSEKDLPETISRLEDQALRKVLQFYDKPDFWYVYVGSMEMQDQYHFAGSEDFRPGRQLATLPHDKPLEDRMSYWVLGTNTAVEDSENITAGSIQHYSTIEGMNTKEPLIKFIEYRIPSLRPGDPYRAYFEINRRKLDLIVKGYYISEQELPSSAPTPSERSTQTMNQLSEQLAAVCEDSSEEENERRYKEYYALAVKNRKEIVRRIRENTLQAHQSASAAHTLDIELGNVLGPMFNDTFGVNLGPFGNLDLSEGRYGQAVGEAVASVVSDQLTQRALTTANAESLKGITTKPDASQLGTLNISWTSLEERVEVIIKDLKEAKKHADEERYTFDPESFNPVKESTNLERILTRIRILIENAYKRKGANAKWEGFQDSPTLAGFFGGGDTSLTINFAFPENPETGLVETQILSIRTAEDIYDLPDDDEKQPKEFRKPIAVGYLSQVFDMTTGTIPGKAEPKVVKDPTGCSDFGKSKNGVPYLKKYTFGLKTFAPPEKKKAKAWYEGWGDRNIGKPVKDWLAKSAKNQEGLGIVDDEGNLNGKVFGQDEALALIGEKCTPAKIWKEFLDKVSLPMLLCDYLKCIGMPGVSIKAPSINIPPVPKIKIFGWYAGFVKFIKDKWQEIIIRILCTIVRMLIDFLSFPLCDQQFREAFGNAGNYSPIIKQALADALFGLPLEQGDQDKAKNFIDDAFRTLRGDEICRLLNGQPLDGAAMALLERLSDHHELGTSWSNRDDIMEFFSVIAGFIPSDFCETLAGLDEIPGGATCRDSTDRLEEMRRRFEANDDVTEEEIAEALDMARQNLMDDETAMQALLDNGLATMVGEYIKIGDPDALISDFPDTINKSIERTSKHTFERAKMDYVTSLSSFVPGLYLPSTKLARAGDESYNQEAVIKVEAALQCLMDFQMLSTRPDSTDPVMVDWRFLSLYQVFEAETITPARHRVHTRYIDNSTEVQTIGAKVTYDQFLSMPPSDERTGRTTTRLRTVSYSKQIKALERTTATIMNESGGAAATINLEDNFGLEFDSTPPGQALSCPHRGMNHHRGYVGPGPFAKSSTMKNPEYIKRGTDAREAFDLPKNSAPTGGDVDRLRRDWRELHNSWLDDNMPEWTTFRRLETMQAKEMFMLNRLQELVEIIEKNLPDASGTETNSEYMSFIKEIFDASVEAALEGTSDEQINGISNVTMRMSADIGPFKPFVSLEEFESNEFRDSYAITVKDRFLFPSSQNGEVFEYCDPVPLHYITTPDGEILNPNDGAATLAKRVVFGQHLMRMFSEDMKKYDFNGFNTPTSAEDLLQPLRGEKQHLVMGDDSSANVANVFNALLGNNGANAPMDLPLYNQAFEGILETVFFKLKDSPMFDEQYAAGVHDRISGKYKKADGCTVNKFNLNHFGILSFDKMITDEIPDLVRAEMARPENQPQNLDYSQPGPIEKALQQAVLKGYVRVCLIELLLKGAIPYSLWDMEAVVGDKFFIDYTNRYVERQLQKHASIKDFWGPIAEKISGINGAHAALRNIIQKELLLMPDLSKLVYNNTQASYDYIDFLTREDIAIIKNQNIPSSFQPVPGKEDQGILQWEANRSLSPNPFLSVEHYLKIEGPVADFTRVIPDINSAARAVLNTVDYLTWPSPDGDKTIREVVQNLKPFGNMVRNLQRMSLDENLNLVPPSLGPILDDSRKDMEIYHIDEVKTMLDAVNTHTAGLDDAMAPLFGLVDVGRGYRPEVLRRTPYRFIKRQRKIFKLTSSEVFDPREDFIKNLTKLSSGARIDEEINFTGDESVSIRENLRLQMVSANAISSHPDRFYIIPFDALGQEMSTDSGISRPENPQSDQYNSWQTKFFRGFTIKSTAGQSGDPLDMTQTWNKFIQPSQRPANDLVIQGTDPGEALFKNSYGDVDEETFNAVKEAVNNPEWLTPGSPSLPDGTSLTTEENWIETVIDFTGDASMVFNNPGESMDEAVESWAKLGLEESVAAWNELKQYLPREEIDILRDSRASQENADLIAIANSPGQGRNLESQNLSVGPSRGLGFKSSMRGNDGRIVDKYSTLQDRLDDPGELTLMQKPDGFLSEYGEQSSMIGFTSLLSDALKKNHYKVPIRLLITQVFVDGQIRQVFSKFVLPETYVPFRSLDAGPYTAVDGTRSAITESRARRFDRVMARIFRDYIEMLEQAYSSIPEALLRRGEVRGSTRRQNSANGLSQKQEMYKKVMEVYRTFPYLVENFWVRNPVEGASQPVKRAKFFSIEKMYSLAAEEEASQAGGVFSQSPVVLDDLFAKRGYLMKDTRSEIGNDGFPSYLFEDIQKFLTTTASSREQKLTSEIERINDVTVMIKNVVSYDYVQNNSSLGDEQFNALYNVLDLIPNLRIFAAFNPTSGTGDLAFKMKEFEDLTGVQYSVNNQGQITGMPGLSRDDYRNLRYDYDASENTPTPALNFRQAMAHWNPYPNTTGEYQRQDILLLQGYVSSMISIFGGTSRLYEFFLAADKSCTVIDQLLEIHSPGETIQNKLLALPEPFRRVVAAGCQNANGEWRTHEDTMLDLDAGIDQTARSNTRYSAFQSDYNREGPASARYTTIRPSDLTNEEYRQFTVFALKLLFMSGQNVASIFLEELTSRNHFAETVDLDLVNDWEFTSADAQVLRRARDEHKISSRILIAIHVLLHGAMGSRNRQLSSTFKHTKDTDYRYRYALDLKRDQRFGLNHLYQYNLHNFIRSDAASLNPRGIRYVENIERCGKVSLSISNMLTWFSQKRSESFYGVTSHPTQVNQYDTGRLAEYIPLDTEVLQLRGQNYVHKRDTPEDKVIIPAHIETPGIMCGFSPFVGDGRYHLEEFLDAYKQYFYSLNPDAIATAEQTALPFDVEFGTDISKQFWEPKIAYFHFINEFITKIQEKYFTESNLPGHRYSALAIKPISIPYHDFKYLEPNEPVSSNYGKFDTPENKYNILKYMLESYYQSTVLASNILLESYEEHTDQRQASTYAANDMGQVSQVEQDPNRYQGPGVLGTNFVLDRVLTREQLHLLAPGNFSSRFMFSGYPGMQSDDKVFLYQPAYSRNLEDHFVEISRQIEARENQLTLVPNMKFYRESGPVYESRFGRSQNDYFMSFLQLQADSAAAMLEQQWQCLLEDTGLFFFFEQYKRIFTESLFDSVETLLSTSNIKDCARLVLNVPSPGIDGIGVLAGLIGNSEAGETYTRDYPQSHPMHRWLKALSQFLTNSNQQSALEVLSSEERAYRLTTPTGGISYSMPLAKFEDGEDFSLLAGGGNVDSMVQRFNSRKYLRTRSLLDTKEGKSVIEYIFPIQRYMSLASIYSTSILGGYSEVPSLMQSTKASLAIIMHLCSINSRQRLDFLEDVSQSEMYKKANDNIIGAGNTAVDCFDLPFSEDMWKTFKEQMLALIKQIPSIILRGIADVLDPAYKEMKIHYENCDIKHLRNSGWSSNAIGDFPGMTNNANIMSGLMQGPDRKIFQGGPEREKGDGVYVPIIPAAFSDINYGVFLSSLFAPFGWWQPGAHELRNSLLRIVSYVYKGPASLLDPTFAFKIPCLDIDEDYKKNWNHGRYGRYGHPLTPFTLLALMTPEINVERIQKAENCADEPEEIENCEDE